MTRCDSGATRYTPSSLGPVWSLKPWPLSGGCFQRWRGDEWCSPGGSMKLGRSSRFPGIKSVATAARCCATLKRPPDSGARTRRRRPTRPRGPGPVGPRAGRDHGPGPGARFPTLLASVHPRPGPYVTSHDALRADAGERLRAEVNETRTETSGKRRYRQSMARCGER